MRVSFIFGTRPEAIKLCPLVRAMRADADFEPHVCATGQHREMLDQVLAVFDLRPDTDLELMQANQSLGSLTARAIAACDTYLAEAKPGMVLVQGDTTTVFCAALAAFYRRIPVGHVEAGLRTWNKFSPFPEEINRTLASRLADLHFAPTEQARENLLREGIAADRIVVTGNTVIDALQFAVARVEAQPPEIPGLSRHIVQDAGSRLVLITGHRRESFGRGFENICGAIAELARMFPNTQFVYPVHLNPNVREPVYRILRRRENIHLIEPLAYLPFVALMHRAEVILTDSGGVQEEAPSLGKPVLVMRDTTERPEAVATGTVRLVGTESQDIIDGIARLLSDRRAYEAMARVAHPYGDGRACGRILDSIRSKLLEPACRE